MKMRNKKWIKNSPNGIVVNSIFAATAGILFVLVLQDPCLAKWYLCCPFIFSFFFFAWTAERITDAVDQESTEKYVAYFLPYNGGVILLFLGIWLILFHKFQFPLKISCITFAFSYALTILGLFVPKSLSFRQRLLIIIIIAAIYCLIVYHFNSTIACAGFIISGFAFYVFSFPWVADSWYLIKWDDEEFAEYLKELKGDVTPESDPHIWEWIFYRFRAFRLWVGNCFNHKQGKKHR
jgi:hypothetical protein